MRDYSLANCRGYRFTTYPCRPNLVAHAACRASPVVGGIAGRRPLERHRGLEPLPYAWKAPVLPFNTSDAYWPRVIVPGSPHSGRDVGVCDGNRTRDSGLARQYVTCYATQTLFRVGLTLEPQPGIEPEPRLYQRRVLTTSTLEASEPDTGIEPAACCLQDSRAAIGASQAYTSGLPLRDSNPDYLVQSQASYH